MHVPSILICLKKMAKKRKEGKGLIMGCADREEIMKLTQMVKSWEFTCSFCFKKFASAQAMGGHQNAHRSERLEEKRLFVRDPIGYRKRAYVRAMKALNPENTRILIEAAPNAGILNLHAASEKVKHELSNVSIQPKKIHHHLLSSKNGRSYCGESDMRKCPYVVMNFLPPKELNLAESVGVLRVEEDEKGMGCMQFSADVEKPDLTLKL